MRELKFRALTKRPEDKNYSWEYFNVRDWFDGSDWYFNPENIDLKSFEWIIKGNIYEDSELLNCG